MQFSKWYKDPRIPNPQSGASEVSLPPSPDPIRQGSSLYVGSDPDALPDLAFGHPIAETARKLIRMGDLKGLENYYLKHKGDDATLIVEAVALNNDSSRLLEEWGLKEPRSGVAQLLCGANFSWRAWEARGGRLASEVSSGQANVFHTFLGEAEKHIQNAIKLRPKDAEPYYRMIRILLGLNGSDPQAHQLLKKVKEFHPHHLYAHMATLTHTCEKWGGSHNDMFYFARNTTANEPEGSPLWALIPMAILERSVYYTIQDDYDGANEFLCSDSVRNELYKAYQMSSGSDKLKETSMTPAVHNWFACNMVYSRLKAAKDALEKVGPHITERPWVYIRVPAYNHVNDLRKDYGFSPI